MGLDFAKSLLPVKSGDNFLDLTAEQVLLPTVLPKGPLLQVSILLLLPLIVTSVSGATTTTSSTTAATAAMVVVWDMFCYWA
jgi:hypothetical protein